MGFVAARVRAKASATTASSHSNAVARDATRDGSSRRCLVLARDVHALRSVLIAAACMLAVAALLTVCAGPTQQPDSTEKPMTGTFVDLSHVIEHGMTTYPGLPGPTVSDHLTRDASRDHYAPGTEFHIARIDMIANTGTYLDTPAHRYAEGFDLAGLALGSVADLPGIALTATERAIGPELLEDLDIAGKALLFATGWDRHWRTERYGAPDHPYLSRDTVSGLVDAQVALVGIDSVNIDDTRGGERPAHSGLLAAGIPLVEHLTGLDRLAGHSFRFFAVPVKVRGVGTFPVRAFAILD